MRVLRIVLLTGVFMLAIAAPAMAANSLAQTSSCLAGSTCAGDTTATVPPTGWGVKMNLTSAKRWPAVVAVWIVMATPVYLSARRRLLPGQS